MKKILLCILPFIMVLASCSKDGKDVGGGTKEPGKVETKELNLSFDVVMPNQAQPNPNQNQKSSSTYALSDVDENAVAVIDVLAFLENGANMEFAEWAKVSGTSISDNGVVSKKKFKVNFTKLVQSPAHKYQFVVIANGRGPVQSLFTGAGAITTGALKDAAMARLKLEGVAGWVSNPTGGGYLHTPMWGEGNATVVTTGLAISDIRLLRMLAKINVTIDENTGVRSKFLLKSVDLYNYNKDGRVVPDATNLASPSKVDKPTNIGVHTEGPVEYAATSVTEMVEEIYTFESKVPYIGLPPAVNLNDVICIVIGGEFGTDGRTTYYRVDLAKKNAQGKYDYMNILRNHGYNINVTNVAGSGYESSIKAFRARAINIEVDIEAWDESDINISYDGQYQFGTNKNKLSFFAEGREQTLLVFADHPSGWEIESKPAWITIDPMSDNSASTKEIKVTATAWAGPGDRVDEFIIKAGNIRKPIKVEQSEDAEISLDVTPVSITFNKSAAQAKPILVKSFPELLVRTITVSGNIEWLPGFSPADANGYSWETFAIQPKPNSSGTTLSSTITISITYNSTTLTRAVTVDQRHTDITFEVFKPTAYPAAGGEVKFGVQSGAPWQLSVDGATISDPGSIIGLITTAEQPESPLTSADYKFNLAPNSSYIERAASFYAKSSNPDFPSQMVEIKQAAYSLVLTPSSTTVDLTTTQQQTVDVTANSGWSVKSVSNMTNVLASIAPAVGAVHTGSTNPANSSTASITLTPSTVVVGLGAAGETVTGSVVLESANHPGATAITRTVTVNRKIQPYWEYNTISPNTGGRLKHEGQNVTVYAHTNMAWKGKSDADDNKVFSAEATAFAKNKQLPITIPQNKAWETKTINVYAQDGGVWANRATYTQVGYTFIYAGGIPTSIPAAGSTNIITCTTGTSSSAVNIRAGIGLTSAVSNEVTVPAIASSATPQSGSVVVPVNGAVSHVGAANRTLTYQWKHPVSGAWTSMGTSTQYGYNLTCTTPTPTWLPAVAHDLSLTFKTTGNIPPGYTARVRIEPGGIIGGRVVIPDLTSPGSVTVALPIPENETWNVSRHVILEYGKDGVGWPTIGTVNQICHDIQVPYVNDDFNLSGGTLSATFTTTGGSPAMNIYFKRKVGKYWDIDYTPAGSIPAISAGDSHTYDYWVPYNGTGTTIQIEFFYYLPATELYYKFASVTQSPFT